MDFDIDDYKSRTARLEWDDLDLRSAFAMQPLSAEGLRCIRYMHDVEFHTICYLRDLLVTPAHADPEITAFLSFWVFEEFWHGEALAAVLEAHGEPAGSSRVATVRRGLGIADKLRPTLMTLGSAVAGADFTAVHMTWGAVNEWTTQAGYAALSQREAHPVLSALLRRIMKQEGRHIDFYASQAERRLAASLRAQKMTRLALRKFWRPVGSGVMPQAETQFLIDTLFAGEAGRNAAARLDRRIDRLPGQSGLHLIGGLLPTSHRNVSVFPSPTSSVIASRDSSTSPAEDTAAAVAS